MFTLIELDMGFTKYEFTAGNVSDGVAQVTNVFKFTTEAIAIKWLKRIGYKKHTVGEGYKKFFKINPHSSYVPEIEYILIPDTDIPIDPK
jgi:hypothetical protein